MRTAGVYELLGQPSYTFILNISLVVRTLQLGGALVNEIKLDNSPVVIVVLDP